MSLERTKRIVNRIKQAKESGETETRLGRVLAKWKDFDIPIGRNGKWLLEGFIMTFKREMEILSAFDPSISPDLPPHLLDPVQIAYFFSLPQDELDWPGIGVRADSIVLQKLSGIENRLVQVMQPPHGSSQVSPAQDENGGHQVEAKEKWLTLRQCADHSGRSASTIRRAIRGGMLRVHNVGRGRKRPSYRVRADELQQYVEAGRVETPDPPTLPTTGVRTKSRHFS